ncbi:MAG: DUF2461 domain-containing protein [Betaproteobacteria bacterium]|nr:DUF2461 domain-containing protein [Betaproteobacteria bacterium]
MHVPALVQFLEGLAENNNRPWFLHNKPAYDILREEFQTLVGEVIQKTAKFDKSIEHLDPKKSMFRIYRDTRFSKNKDPYKTHFSAVIGDKKTGDPCYYFQITHEGKLGGGGGIYMPEPPALKKIREAIVEDSASFTKLMKNKKFTARFGGLMDEDRLQRPPKGFPADHPHIEAIKNRHFFGWHEQSIAKRAPKDLAGEVAAQFADAEPLVTWLRGVLKR